MSTSVRNTFVVRAQNRVYQHLQLEGDAFDSHRDDAEFLLLSSST